MKRVISLSMLLALGAIGYLSAQAAKQETMPPPKPSTPAFDRIKALAGEWEGKTSEGRATRTSYKIVSNGSAVMNVLDPAGEYEMITMFHLDGPDVMVTHYCAMGNQPRMVAKGGAGGPNVIQFAFKDVTNLTQPNEGHMYGLVLTIVDADHHRQEWIFRQNGKDLRDVFEFARKK